MRDEIQLLRKAELLEALGISEWTLKAWIRDQRFPRPLFTCDGAPARWRLGEVRRWLDRRELRRRKTIRRGALRQDRD